MNYQWENGHFCLPSSTVCNFFISKYFCLKSVLFWRYGWVELISTLICCKTPPEQKVILLFGSTTKFVKKYYFLVWKSENLIPVYPDRSTTFPAAFGGQRFALEIWSKTLLKKCIYTHRFSEILEILENLYIYPSVYIPMNSCIRNVQQGWES